MLFSIVVDFRLPANHQLNKVNSESDCHKANFIDVHRAVEVFVSGNGCLGQVHPLSQFSLGYTPSDALSTQKFDKEFILHAKKGLLHV